jgi:hypothetical protein
MMIIFFALIGAVALGFLTSLLVYVLTKQGEFVVIKSHAGILVAVLGMGVFLIYYFGFNAWSASILPVVVLVLGYLVVRRAIARLLELK